MTIENLSRRRLWNGKIINRDEESYVTTTSVDIVDDDDKEFSCIVETRITNVGGMPITDREIIWYGEEPKNREEIERKILEDAGINRGSQS